MKKQLFKAFALLCVIIFIQTGCKSKQKVAVGKIQSPVEILVGKIHEAEPKFNNLEFKKMSVSLNLNNKKRYSSNASCKIMHDSIIYISLQPFLGIEMFNLRLMPSRIVLVDKIKGIYYPLDYSMVKNVYDIDISYKDIQALFTNKLFSIAQQEAKDKLLVQSFEKMGERKLFAKSEILNQEVTVNETHRINDVLISSKSGKESLRINYDNFISIDSINFPSDIKFQFKYRTELYDCNFSISKMSVNEPINIPEINLNFFREGDITSLLK
ncbi:DUF4292 domain-containing protein [Paludibacter sp.]